jgi:hypothetical protein
MVSQLNNIRDQAAGKTAAAGKLKQLYKIRNLPTSFHDGAEPFPDNEADLVNGVSVEFW